MDLTEKVKYEALKELEEFRKKVGWSKNELARNAGKLQSGDYIAFLNQKKFPNLRTIVNIGDGMGYDAKIIFIKRDENPNT